MILFFAIGSNLFFKPSCKTQESAPLSHVAFNERFVNRFQPRNIRPYCRRSKALARCLWRLTWASVNCWSIWKRSCCRILGTKLKPGVYGESCYLTSASGCSSSIGWRTRSYTEDNSDGNRIVSVLLFICLCTDAVCSFQLALLILHRVLGDVPPYPWT